MVNDKLIFDLGFCDGKDTENYISKGFKVMAVEANIELYDIGLRRFKDEISEGNLILLNKAIYCVSNTKTDFYINYSVPEWGSIKKEIAEQDKTKSIKHSVETITFAELCKEYEVPHYCKVDIESADIFVAIDLCFYQPQFISFELNQKDYFEFFYRLKNYGYSKFQLVNQGNCKPFGSSGEFGEYLQKDKWIDFDEALSRYIKFKELRNLDRKNLSFGWLDLHATF